MSVCCLQVYPKNQAASKGIFQQMRDYAAPFSATGWYKRSEYGVNLEGSMTDAKKAKTTLFVSTEGYNSTAGASYHAWCEGRVNIIGIITITANMRTP